MTDSIPLVQEAQVGLAHPKGCKKGMKEYYFLSKYTFIK